VYHTPSSSVGASEHWHSAESSFRDSASVAQLHGRGRAQCARVGKGGVDVGAGRCGRQQKFPTSARYGRSNRRCRPLQQRALPPAVPVTLPVGRGCEFPDRRGGWVWLGVDE
jgi:hypothetical protein